MAGTGAGPSAAMVPSLSPLSAVRTTVQGTVAPAAHAIVQKVSFRQQSAQDPALSPFAGALPGLAPASSVLTTVTNLYNSVPGMASSPNQLSGLSPQSTKLPGISMGAGTVAGLAKSVTPGDLPGTVSNVSQAAGGLPGAPQMPSLHTVGNAVNDVPGVNSATGSLSHPLSEVGGPLSGVTGLLGGSGLPVSGLPVGGLLGG